MTEVREHGEVHFNMALGGYKSCICLCDNCMSLKTAKCVCKECSCRDKRFKTAPTHEPEPEVLHPCSECGQETTRNGTRGRWPSKCLECK